MTDNEINESVALAHGWTKSDMGWPDNGGVSDLNAIMAAVMIEFNTPAKRMEYRRRLENVVSRSIKMEPDRTADSPETAAIFANARQHCETFLRVKGLWKD